jgi:putative tryptophan/tyrosine transport system substrate-binding protein
MTQSGHGCCLAWVRRTAQFSIQKCDSLLVPDLVLGAGEAMRRREFIRLFSSTVVAWPLAARAQKSAVPVIGFLRSTTAAGSEDLATAFEQGLKDAGFVASQNVAIDYRWGNDQSDQLPGLAADLIRRQPAVIIGNILAIRAVMAATTTIPIIFVGSSDPVREGLVASLNHPGGNITGVVFASTDLIAKRLGLLHDLVPKSVAIAALFHPGAPAVELQKKDVEVAGQTIGRQVLSVDAADEREFHAAFATMVQQNAGGLLIGSGPYFLSRRRQLAALAVRHALPSCGPLRSYAEVGVLMSYGSSQADAYRRAGNYAGRILKGEKPPNMPVEMATKLDLVINLATAKALDLSIPPNLLTLADEVIE